jgi:hypothetical protein
MGRSLTKDWIIGFTEGEGCFHFSKGNSKSRGSKAIFDISQDERYILEQIRDFFGFGCIRRVRRPDGTSFRFYVQKFSDILRLVDFFEGNLKSKKRWKQFKAWKKSIIALKKAHYSPRYHWLPEMDEEAKKLLLAGIPAREIGKRLGKSKRAVIMRNHVALHVDVWNRKVKPPHQTNTPQRENQYTKSISKQNNLIKYDGKFLWTE